MHYTVWQWLLFFYIYCFFGWCFESTFVSVRKRRFVNRGFLHSPLLPIYGFGAVIMLLVTLRIREHLVLMFFAGMAGATLLELVVGLSMEAVFKIKYWDYSNQRFNYKGVICLSSSVCWGFFTVLLNKAIHRPVEAFVLGLPEGVTLAAALVALRLVSALLEPVAEDTLIALADKFSQVAGMLLVICVSAAVILTLLLGGTLMAGQSVVR